MVLAELALAPAAIFLVYIYIRDKYEKEPVNLLLTGIFFGTVSTGLVLCLDNRLDLLEPSGAQIFKDLYSAYVMSAGVEEGVKYLFLFFLVWKNRNFNEPFDGIVYAVFISLGFAMVENFVYVFNPVLGGVRTAFSRAFLAVPAHGVFGISMGYNLSFSRFGMKKGGAASAFFWPWFLHGTYNFIIFRKSYAYMIIFIPFLFYLWSGGFYAIEKHLEKSPFKKTCN